MGRMQKRKGSRIEREIVNYLKERGINAKRVPLSGSSSIKGDILINDFIRCEVKARKDGKGFKTIQEWLKGNTYLFLKANYEKVLVVMDIDEFIKLRKQFSEGKNESNQKTD